MKKLLVIPILLLHYSAMLILFPIDIAIIVLQRGAEFLSNVLERVNWNYDDYVLKPAAQICGYALGIMQSDEATRRPWVSVTDKLPEENPDEKGYSVEVIGLFPDGSVSKCSCSIEEGIWFIEGLTCDKPTHWMPMPKV